LDERRSNNAELKILRTILVKRGFPLSENSSMEEVYEFVKTKLLFLNEANKESDKIITAAYDSFYGAVVFDKSGEIPKSFEKSTIYEAVGDNNTVTIAWWHDEQQKQVQIVVDKDIATAARKKFETQADKSNALDYLGLIRELIPYQLNETAVEYYITTKLIQEDLLASQDNLQEKTDFFSFDSNEHEGQTLKIINYGEYLKFYVIEKNGLVKEVTKENENLLGTAIDSLLSDAADKNINLGLIVGTLGKSYEQQHYVMIDLLEGKFEPNFLLQNAVLGSQFESFKNILNYKIKNLSKEETNNLILLAAQQPATNFIGELVQKSVDANLILNAISEKHPNALDWAIDSNDPDVALFLIHHGVNLEGKSPLIWAASNGFTELIEPLLKRKVYADKPDTQWKTPLYYAANNGHTDIVKKLLATREVNVNHAISKGNTPLYAAAVNGHIKIVEILLAENAEINTTDIQRHTPLYWAVNKGHTEIIKLFIVHNLKNGLRLYDTKELTMLIRQLNNEQSKDLVPFILESYIGNNKPELMAAVAADPAIQIMPIINKLKRDKAFTLKELSDIKVARILTLQINKADISPKIKNDIKGLNTLIRNQRLFSFLPSFNSFTSKKEPQQETNKNGPRL